MRRISDIRTFAASRLEGFCWGGSRLGNRVDRAGANSSDWFDTLSLSRLALSLGRSHSETLFAPRLNQRRSFSVEQRRKCQFRALDQSGMSFRCVLGDSEALIFLDFGCSLCSGSNEG